MSKLAGLFHGYGGKRKDSWMTWLEHELLLSGFSVCYPIFPNPKQPVADMWLRSVADLSQSRSVELLVGHSLGSIFSFYFIENYHGKIGSVHLASPLVPNLNDGLTIPKLKTRVTIAEWLILKAFIQHEFNFLKITQRVKNLHFWWSNNDPHVLFPRSMEYYCKMFPKAQMHVLKDRGHMNEKAGMTSFPEILEFI